MLQKRGRPWCTERSKPYRLAPPVEKGIEEVRNNRGRGLGILILILTWPLAMGMGVGMASSGLYYP